MHKKLNNQGNNIILINYIYINRIYWVLICKIWLWSEETSLKSQMKVSVVLPQVLVGSIALSNRQGNSAPLLNYITSPNEK